MSRDVFYFWKVPSKIMVTTHNTQSMIEDRGMKPHDVIMLCIYYIYYETLKYNLQNMIY